MPKSKKEGGSNRVDKQLSARTKKQIDSLPEHAQHIYKKAHANAIEQYQNPKAWRKKTECRTSSTQGCMVGCQEK